MVDQISAVLNKILPLRIRHDFLLPYFLALYSMSQIKSSKRSHSYSFVRELSMKVHSSLLHGEIGPSFKSFRIDQKVYMFLIKLSHKLLAGQSHFRHERFSALILNLVHTKF